MRLHVGVLPRAAGNAAGAGITPREGNFQENIDGNPRVGERAPDQSRPKRDQGRTR